MKCHFSFTLKIKKIIVCICVYESMHMHTCIHGLMHVCTSYEYRGTCMSWCICGRGQFCGMSSFFPLLHAYWWLNSSSQVFMQMLYVLRHSTFSPIVLLISFCLLTDTVITNLLLPLEVGFYFSDFLVERTEILTGRLAQICWIVSTSNSLSYSMW